MFGGNSSTSVAKASETEPKSLSSEDKLSSDDVPGGGGTSTSLLTDSNATLVGNGSESSAVPMPIKPTDTAAAGEKRSGNSSPPGSTGTNDKKRRSSGVGTQARNLLASAKNTLNIGSGRNSVDSQSPLQKLGKQDPALAVPQGQYNNSAGESLPGPRSTFRVGVWEDRNKKCRRTMEDTHAFLYNFLPTPAPVIDGPSTASSKEKLSEPDDGDTNSKQPQGIIETDNGYFAIFDGHAGTFAADWCGKKLHIILGDMIRKNPNTPIPELLDQTFTNVDSLLEKLPSRGSGCTAAIAVLRWEDRVPSERSATGSQAIAPATAKAVTRASISNDELSPKKADEPAGNDDLAIPHPAHSPAESVHARLKSAATRQRVLYTANVGDARIILCRAGKALRLSYDHKGSDENEGKRVSNAGGLILNNRVNGVLAVTRALGDGYMKDLVTGHPYTTETVIQPDSDEFIIIACDGLWDVCSDQEAVDLVRNVTDPFAASKLLVDHALNRFSTDNLSCLIVRFDRAALLDNQTSHPIGVEGDFKRSAKKPTEVEKIIAETKSKIDKGAAAAIGVSGSDSAAPGRDEIEQNMAFG